MWRSDLASRIEVWRPSPEVATSVDRVAWSVTGRKGIGVAHGSSFGSQMLTRIMWLSGLESGFNRLGNVDTMQRFIYIHGCPDEDELGKPGSHGCIKMSNTDVIDLFDRVAVGTPVHIVENTES